MRRIKNILFFLLATSITSYVGWNVGLTTPDHVIRSAEPVGWDLNRNRDFITSIKRLQVSPNSPSQYGKQIVCWSHDGKKLASASLDGTHNSPQENTWAVSPKADFVAEVVDSVDPTPRKVLVVKSTSNQEVLINASLDPGEVGELELLFSADSAKLFVRVLLKGVDVWDLKGKKLVKHLSSTVSAFGHTFRLINDGNELQDGMAFWDTETLERGQNNPLDEPDWQATIPSVTYAPNLHYALVEHKNNDGGLACKIIDMNSDDFETLEPYRAENPRVTGRVALTEDDKAIGFVSHLGSLKPVVWNLRTGSLECKIDPTHELAYCQQIDAKTALYWCVHPWMFEESLLRYLPCWLVPTRYTRIVVDLDSRNVIWSRSAMGSAQRDLTINRARTHIVLETNDESAVNVFAVQSSNPVIGLTGGLLVVPLSWLAVYAFRKRVASIG